MRTDTEFGPVIIVEEPDIFQPQRLYTQQDLDAARAEGYRAGMMRAAEIAKKTPSEAGATAEGYATQRLIMKTIISEAEKPTPSSAE